MVNVPGVLGVASALIRPGILRPHITVQCTPSALTQPWRRSTGTKSMLPASDSLFSTRITAWYVHASPQTRPYEDHLVPALQRSWDECKQVFGSDNILLVSNSAGTRSDPRAIAAESVSSELGVPVLLHATKKPGKRCARQIVEHFRELIQRSREPDAVPHVLVVGDRITTDIVLASRIGGILRSQDRPMDSGVSVNLDAAPRLPLCTSMLTTQIWAPEKLGTRLMRGVEDNVLKALIRVGIPPDGGWRMRAKCVPPAWLRDLPKPLPVVPTEKTPTSIVLDAAASLLPLRPRKVLRGMGRLGLRLLHLRHVARLVRAIDSGWKSIFSEVFKSVRHTRALTWSFFTNAPTDTWASTWRSRRQNGNGAVPPVGSLRSSKRSRMFSTCAAVRAGERPAHERPIARRAPPSPAPESPKRSGFLGISLRQWLMALGALIILPTGFIGGVKLNDAVARWRQGEPSEVGHAENMQDLALPAEREAEKADATNSTATQLSKRIQEYVVCSPRLERDYFFLAREREDVQHKLDRLMARGRV